MISLSAVSYLNTKPFIIGLKRSGLWHKIAISLETPAQTARKLLSGEVQIGLVPVAVIPQLPPQSQLITNYCIGTTGAVKTVCLYSRVPLNEIKRIWLDYQSRTSVQLVQLLCRHYWQIQPEFLAATAGFETAIEGNTAGVVIGDRAIDLNNQYEYIYDLGEAWIGFAQLPFVFAAWVATNPIPPDFEIALNAAFAVGMQHIDEVVREYQSQYPPDFDIKTYLTQHISYDFDAAKRQGLARFLQLLAQ